MECIVLLPTLSLHFLLQCISTEAGERDSKTLYDLHHHHGRRGLIRQSIVTCLCPLSGNVLICLLVQLKTTLTLFGERIASKMHISVPKKPELPLHLFAKWGGGLN